MRGGQRKGGGSRGARAAAGFHVRRPTRSARAPRARWGVWDRSAVDGGRRGQTGRRAARGVKGRARGRVDRGGEGPPGGIEEGLVEQLDQVVALEVDHQHEGLHDGEPLEKVDVALVRRPVDILEAGQLHHDELEDVLRARESSGAWQNQIVLVTLLGGHRGNRVSDSARAGHGRRELASHLEDGFLIRHVGRAKAQEVGVAARDEESEHTRTTHTVSAPIENTSAAAVLHRRRQQREARVPGVAGSLDVGVSMAEELLVA